MYHPWRLAYIQALNYTSMIYYLHTFIVTFLQLYPCLQYGNEWDFDPY